MIQKNRWNLETDSKDPYEITIGPIHFYERKKMDY